MATIIPKTQAMQNHELRKIDSKLSSIKEAIEALVKFNKQNEIDKLGLNLFQKRKAFSDFL